MIITVRVSPKSKKSELIPESATLFRAKVRSAPEKGKANAELVQLIAAHFGIKRSEVRIVRGERGREKYIEIPDPN